MASLVRTTPLFPAPESPEDGRKSNCVSTVGDVAANQEPAIVVSGLKPNHFYNVRVIAVGSNNFQAGSRVIRLRTFGRDGRPQLGNARLPSNFLPDEQSSSAQGDHVDENGVPKSPGLALESAPPPDAAPTLGREGSSTASSGPRRNTVTRRHSPSTTSMDAPPIRSEPASESGQSLPELTERFESIRKETEELTALIAKEESDNKRHLDELEAEKQEKKKEQKKKEEQTEKLKREVNATDRLMRNAMQRKTQKEKLLKDKQNERLKLHGDIAKWEKGIADMRREQENFDGQKEDLEAERDKKLENFRRSTDDLQRECARLEAELKEKRDQVKELEDARKRLPGGEEDAEWRERDVEFKKACQQRQRELHEALVQENRITRRLDEQLRILSMQVGHIPGAQPGYGIYTQANSSGIDFDNTSVNALKRRSRNSNSLSNVSISSPLPPYSQIDPSTHGPPGFGGPRPQAPQSFAQGPFMDLSADMPPRLDEAGIRAMSAPLSPSATALLPSNILDDFDDDDDSPTSRFGPEFFPQYAGSPEHYPQSPASSSRSMSIPVSSPRGSSHHLPFPAFADSSDGRSLHAADNMASPVSTGLSTNKLSSFFSFQRSRNLKGVDENGPALGSLKAGQSQSFPRQTGEPDALTNKRRTSLSGSWNMFNRNSAGPAVFEGYVTGTRGFSVRTLNPFSSSNKGSSAIFSEADPSSPRPASIASTDFPRPSTEGGSIWGPYPAEGSTLGKQSRLWSPEASWSRNPSRRASLHGSPSALKTTLASADDEILDEETMPNASEVGVIGRPLPASSRSFARLNPNAPAFMGSLFRGKPDKDKDSGKEKGKGKDRGKDAREKTRGGSIADTPLAPPFEAESPTDSRKSRDGLSVHTQPSISESRESLSLDQPLSNTPSEATSTGMASSIKDDNVVRKLFRKGSSSKFSLPGRLGGKDGSSLFKKGPGSTTSVGNSEKGNSVERASIGEVEDVNSRDEGSSSLGRSYDSATGSPSLGPILSNTRSAKDGKTGSARWLSFSKKAKKEKESLDLERDRVSESEGFTDDNTR